MLTTNLYHRARPVLDRVYQQPQFRRFFQPLASQLETETIHAWFTSDTYTEYCQRFDERWDAFPYDSTIGDISKADARNYYALLRELEPTTVVETGVANGLSTLAFLWALDDNDHGHLYSIDYPVHADEPRADFDGDTQRDYPMSVIPSDAQPGWIIPDDVRDHWTLHIGKSQTILPDLRSDLDAIDLFVHDSEHSTPCMLYEYELAWDWLTNGGVLLSDDVTTTPAHRIFLSNRATDADAWYFEPNVALIQKQPETQPESGGSNDA